MTAAETVRHQHDLEISDATADDREWAARLMSSSEPWLTLGRNLASCRQVLDNVDASVFVARIGAERVGFAICHRRGVVGSPYLATLAVAPAWRSCGVGRALVEFVEAFFRPYAQHLFLCVSSFNQRARALYERLGYAQVGELPAYFLPDASELLFHKRLRD